MYPFVHCFLSPLFPIRLHPPSQIFVCSLSTLHNASLFLILLLPTLLSSRILCFHLSSSVFTQPSSHLFLLFFHLHPLPSTFSLTILLLFLLFLFLPTLVFPPSLFFSSPAVLSSFSTATTFSYLWTISTNVTSLISFAGHYIFSTDTSQPEILFTNNETNFSKADKESADITTMTNKNHFKDSFHDYVIKGLLFLCCFIFACLFM